ncbi:hypothetical protein [Candidatus Mycosynbacter amalyticus]|uniref:hypothetical protein n=1 Tax=Candidatus Mycosynbacter amalyticus TaxID=2665156 RepID=UPI0021B31CEB|nr:hypothetical protein [Candidatus Mycosynbacter amalyticus]
MTRRNPLTLYCFSPLVMLLTFAFEMIAALIVLVRYRSLPASKLIIAVLLCLAIFQLAEYMICVSALDLSSLGWARVGWVAISFLPPLGVHLGMIIAGKSQRLIVGLGYAIAIGFSAFFLTVGHAVQGGACLGNYVIFEMARPALTYYILYYYVWLMVGTAAAFIYARAMKQPARRSALNWLGIGYLVFIVPTIAANLLQPETLAAIPSVMCGFAVLLAAVLLFVVTPKLAQLHK